MGMPSVNDTIKQSTVMRDVWTLLLKFLPITNTLREEALSATTDKEKKAQIRGVSSQMTTFQIFFGLVLSQLILRHTDQLSKSLQNPDLSSIEGHYIAM